ncbi:chemotaxis protein MotB [Crenobacter luteus]|uniref:flagellar motor protein MotB n=1 Tax=Crenobacter luteus TaxID=1452487 RepID=UPI001045A406|nr:flagellar motor protein MotB [Crenobacter luteus]TCP15611.1 chemotaxis protein MotB [Crenobacter luteus]
MSTNTNKNPRHEGEAVIKKVSRRQEGEGHGGAWKVAFADFVLALMCLFLVMWLMAAREQENLAKQLMGSGGSPMAEGSNRLIEHQGNPRGSLIPREPVPGQPAAEARPNAQLKNSAHPSVLDGDGAPRRQRYDSAADLEKLAKMIAELSAEAGLTRNIRTVVTPDGLRVMLHDTDKQGMFERGSAILDARFAALLGKIGRMFAGVDNQLLLVGHTDALPYRGTHAYSNWTLSSHRAMSARERLLAGGMDGGRILQVVGMAERAPLDRRNPNSAVNRRIELLVLTSAQAQALSRMYGMPAESVTLPASAELPRRLEGEDRVVVVHD